MKTYRNMASVLVFLAGLGTGSGAAAEPASPSIPAQLDRLQGSVDRLTDSVAGIDASVTAIQEALLGRGAIRAGTLPAGISQYAQCAVFNIGATPASFQVYLYDAGSGGSRVVASIQELSVGPLGADSIGSVGPLRQAWCLFVPNTPGAIFRAYLQAGSFGDDSNSQSPSAVLEAR